MKKIDYSFRLKLYYTLLMIVFLIMGVSYAYYRKTISQETQSNISTLTCFNTSITDVTSAINLKEEYPIPDSEGITKEPYTFKVTNNCNQYLTISIGVETLNTSGILPKYIKGSIVDSGTTPTDGMLLSSGIVGEAVNNGTTYIIYSSTINPNSSKNFDLRLWLNETTTAAEAFGKSYQGKIVVTATAKTNPQKNLNDVILLNNGGVEEISKKNKPNFASTPTTNEGLFAGEDDYGTSYYFRGMVNNNWVKFAGFYWRIIRINGDGSIRIIYSGKTAPTSSEKVVILDSGTNIGSEAFNSGVVSLALLNNKQNDNTIAAGGICSTACDNAFVGYMYTQGELHGASANATVKLKLDSWYKENLESYSNIISNTGFCNDRSFTGGTGLNTSYTTYSSYSRN